MSPWLIIIGMGLITFSIRLLPIALLHRINLPPLIWQALRFVPTAVLSAIVFPALLQPNDTFDLSLSNVRLLAGLMAIIVAWRSKKVLLTIGVGMLALWALQGIIGR